MTKLDDTMTHLVFTEDEGQYKTKLTLWRTVKNKLWLEMGPEDEDPMLMQGMVLDLYDARKLLTELHDIIQAIESEPIQENDIPETLPLWAQHEKEGQKKIFANT